MQPQPSVEGALIGWQIRVADEEEVCLEAPLGERPRQLLDSHAEAAGLRVLIGTLEGEQDNGGLFRLQHQRTRAPNSSSA